MSVVLQVAVVLASLAFIVLAACLVPLAFQARRHLAQMALAVDQVKCDLDVLVHDSRELVRNANALTTRAGQQMDDVAQVVHTVRQWTQRADRLFGKVGMAIEPPVFSLVRNMNVVRTGVTSLLRALLQRNQNSHTQ